MHGLREVSGRVARHLTPFNDDLGEVTGSRTKLKNSERPIEVPIQRVGESLEEARSPRSPGNGVRDPSLGLLQVAQVDRTRYIRFRLMRHRAKVRSNRSIRNVGFPPFFDVHSVHRAATMQPFVTTLG